MIGDAFEFGHQRAQPMRPSRGLKPERIFGRAWLVLGHESQVKLYEGISAEVLAWMAATDGFWQSFDFIYIDGSHLARDVFIDAALSWNLLKIGGLIGFDDYHWGDPNDPLRRPQIAIDAFERIFADRLTLVLDGSRRFYRKLLA